MCADSLPVILVAADDVRIRSFIARLITQLQGVPLLVADGAAALAVVQTYGSTLAGALLDVRMPHTSGIAVAAAMQQQGLTIPIILMHGAIPRQDGGELRTLRSITVLQKPFELTDIQTLLRLMISQWEQSDHEPNR